MKCYYHAERDAVGTCQDCGIALCKECASKYTPCLCPDCAQKRKIDNQITKEANKRKHMRDVNTEFMKTLIPASICGIVVFVLALFVSDSEISTALIVGIEGFFIVYGWKISVFLKNSDPDNAMVGILSFALRLGFSAVLGIPCFIFSLFRFVKGKEENRRM